MVELCRIQYNLAEEPKQLKAGTVLIVNDPTVGCFRLGFVMYDGTVIQIPIKQGSEESRARSKDLVQVAFAGWPGWYLVRRCDYQLIHDCIGEGEIQKVELRSL